MKVFRRLALFSVLTLSFVQIKAFCLKETRGFRASNIFLCNQALSLPPCYELLDEQQEKILNILSQPYFFLEKGHQCYAFISKDQQYVLKLLQADKISIPLWSRLWPYSQKSLEQQSKRKERQKRDLLSYHIAYTKLREETGLVYAQLSPSPQLTGSLTVYDPIHIRHKFPIESICFLLQKKAEPLYPLVLNKVSQGKAEELYPIFSKLADQLQKRSTLELDDFDLSLEDNIGIIEKEPICFDVGTITQKKTLPKELAHLILETLWKESPDLAAFLEERLQKDTLERQENF